VAIVRAIFKYRFFTSPNPVVVLITFCVDDNFKNFFINDYQQ
jgi:hypothetical protein